VKRPWLRLLPPGTPLGWTPFAWLIYLPTFLVGPILDTRAGEAGLGYWAVTVLVIVAFLYSYFRGFWLRGRRLLPHIAFQTALGDAFASINPGSCVFFVYAGSFAAQMERQRNALQTLLLVAGIGLVTAFATRAELFFWLTAVAVTLVVGGVNLHFAQTGRAQRKLRLAQDEIEHLAKVAERERIARELHDELGHTLSLVVLKSELAARLVDRDATRAAAEMRDVEDVARRTLQDVREAIRGYRASFEDEIARARSLLKAAEIAVDFAVDVQPLPQAVEETLALALREAITNVVRHSGATRCGVRLSREDDRVVLEVADDGRGAGRSPEGAGLRGMRERVEAFDGVLQRPGGGRGMRLRITMPAVAPERPDDVDAGRGLAG
jgi:two-component system sensor histidine kinase DesK